MKVLVTTPICVPSYFNAGHRLHLFEVSGYLRSKGHAVEAVDLASLNVTWKHLADLLVQKHYDLIVIMNDFDLIEGMGRVLKYVDELSPSTKTITFGRLSSMKPRLFYQYEQLDAVVAVGDYEAGVYQYICYLETGSSPVGVAINSGIEWMEPIPGGVLLPAEEWVLPDVSEIAYSSIDNLYQDDQMKFCGIPDRRELVIPLARGCPVGCNFCEVWPREGLKERRLSVQRTIEYAQESFEKQPFDYVSMYAPTFTLKKFWVRELCKQLISLGNPWPWKCTTTMFHLDRDLVLLMGQAGCFRISIGLETFEDQALGELPGMKHDAKEKFDQLYLWCQEAGIELNCFVIVGLPGTTVAGTVSTFQYLSSKENVRIRPSIMSDYGLLVDEMNEDQVIDVLARHLLPQSTTFSSYERAELYKLVFWKDSNLTQVMNRIPKTS